MQRARSSSFEAQHVRGLLWLASLQKVAEAWEMASLLSPTPRESPYPAELTSQIKHRMYEWRRRLMRDHINLSRPLTPYTPTRWGL